MLNTHICYKLDTLHYIVTTQFMFTIAYIFSELSVASVDIQLSITVAKNVAKTIQLLCVKSEQLVCITFSCKFSTFQILMINFYGYIQLSKDNCD